MIRVIFFSTPSAELKPAFELLEVVYCILRSLHWPSQHTVRTSSVGTRASHFRSRPIARKGCHAGARFKQVIGVCEGRVASTLLHVCFVRVLLAAPLKIYQTCLVVAHRATALQDAFAGLLECLCLLAKRLDQGGSATPTPISMILEQFDLREDPREALLSAVLCSWYLLFLLSVLRISNLLVRIGGLDKTVSKLLLLLGALVCLRTDYLCHGRLLFRV